MLAQTRHSTCWTAQLWDATCNVGDGQHPCGGGKTRPGPNVLQQRSGSGAAFLPAARWDLSVLRSPEVSPPKCPLSTSFQGLRKG